MTVTVTSPDGAGKCLVSRWDDGSVGWSCDGAKVVGDDGGGDREAGSVGVSVTSFGVSPQQMALRVRVLADQVRDSGAEDEYVALSNAAAKLEEAGPPESSVRMVIK